MANILIERSSMENIANAIRAKNGTQETYTPAEMSTAIENIPAGSSVVLPNGIKFKQSTASDFSFLLNCDTSNLTDTREMFSLIQSSAPIIPSFDTSNVTNMRYMFSQCTNLTSIPMLNTSKVTDMSSLFSYCSALITVPVLDTSSVTSMIYMFQSCPNLSNESLNNILQMCIPAKLSNINDKNLRQLGLTSAQATTCQSLSNWDAFVAAGWSTGY